MCNNIFWTFHFFLCIAFPLYSVSILKKLNYFSNLRLVIDHILILSKRSISLCLSARSFFVVVVVLQEQFQLYTVIYDLYDVNGPLRRFAAIDRYLININLGIPPAQRKRQTYSGIYNISFFDISFSVKCSENFYGPDCNTMCIPVLQLYSCDDIGRKICKDESCDPTTNCRECSPPHVQSPSTTSIYDSFKQLSTTSLFTSLQSQSTTSLSTGNNFLRGTSNNHYIMK